ncbi:efflux RND transporter periplasmic adaptor subunit [Candidatus Desantisbacteria bacterium]|nr:efflux RND transporter periplasmic adaptor subunit [Candidatus Desantisbacteria bacterium]
MKYLNILSFCTLILLSACGKQKELPSDAKSMKIKDNIPLVKTIKAKRGVIEEKTYMFGNLESYDDVNVSSKNSGRVMEVFFDEGDYVKKGDLLFTLEDTEINIQLKQSEIAVKSTEILLEKARLGVNILDDKSSVSIKQTQAGVDASKAVYAKITNGAREQEKEQARLGVAEAEITLDNAKVSLARMEKLLKSGSIPKPQYEAVKLQYDLAESRLKIAREILSLISAGARDEDKLAAEANISATLAAREMAETTKKDKLLLEQDIKNFENQMSQLKLNIELIKTILLNTKITAPISGVIIKRSVNTGEIVAPGAPVFSISKLDILKLKVEVPESEILKIKKGMLVKIIMDAYPDRIFNGKINFISPVMNLNTRTCAVEIEIKNSDRELKPGMFAKVELNIGKKENVLIIPKDVLIFEDEKHSLFVIQNNIAIKKFVTLGLSQNENTEIINGLNESEEIIYIGILQPSA